MKKWCVRKRYSILFVLLMFCIACHDISKSYGFYFPTDEFGYWSYAASLAGYDWSDIVSLGSYYSYGYSLILFPVFLLCKNGVIAYRAALLVNFVLLIVSYFILQKMEKSNLPFSAAVAVFYPAWLFYAGTTFAEIVLVTLYIVICSLLGKYLKTGKNRFMVLMVLAMLYMYFVHMRAIGILLSGIVTVAIYDIQNGRKKAKYLLALVLCAALVLVMGALVKKYWTDIVYDGVPGGLKNWNDYAGQIEKIAYIFTKDGWKDFIISISGKLLYLGLASFGIAYAGIGYAVSKVIRLKNDRANYFYLFVLLTTLAAVMTCAVYTIHPGRVDTLAYGRYHEYIMPVLMITGIRALREEKRSARGMIYGIFILLASEAVMTWLVSVSLCENGQTAFFGNTICGISWLYNSERFEPVLFYWKTYLVGAVLTVLSGIGIWWTGRQKGREIFLMVLVAVQIAISVRLSSMYVDASRLGCFRDTFVVQKIQELNAANSREVYYSTDGENFGNIGILQFMIRDTKIHIIRENFVIENQSVQDLLLVDYRSSQAGALEKAYTRHLTSGHFSLYYNEIK